MMEYKLNVPFIRNRIKELGTNIAQVERDIGYNANRLCHTLKECDKYRLNYNEAIDLAKRLDCSLNSIGEGFPCFTKPDWQKIEEIRMERDLSKKEMSGILGKSKAYYTTLSYSKCEVEISTLDTIAKMLRIRISEVADIPSKFDRDYSCKSSTADELCPLPFALNCSEMLSPVEVVKALPNVVDFAHWHKLEESPNPHMEHRINGIVAWRYQDGHAVLFANEHIKHEHICVAMEQIKEWGERQRKIESCSSLVDCQVSPLLTT